MKLKIYDVLNAISMARDFYKNLPAEAKLENTKRSMDESERVALSYFHAFLNLANKEGWLKENVNLQIEYDFEDSFTATDGYESESGVEEPQK